MIDDGIIPHNQVQPSSPIPNPAINTLVHTADRVSATNPTGQLDKMYAYAYLMDNTAFAARSNIPEFYGSRILSVLRRLYTTGSVDAWLQTLNYLQDPKFVGFVSDPTMKARFMLAASSKIVTLLPELLTQVKAFHENIEPLKTSTTQVVEKIREGAKDAPLIRTALTFQTPSLYLCAEETMILYHALYLICLSLNGIESLMIPQQATEGNIARVKLREVAVQIDDEFFKVAPHLSFLWNQALSAVNDRDIPDPSAMQMQNLNVVQTVFELAPLTTHQEYTYYLMQQFKRTTDRKTPNWLSPAFAAQPVSIDAVTYTAASTQKSLLDLKTLIYSREV